jgi:cytochrome c oxidase assembly factor 6
VHIDIDRSLLRMFGFGSSSSSSSSANSSSTEPSLPAAPNREERKACWESRDLYFGCLDKNGVLVAGQADAGGKRVCEAERKGYEGSCSKSWVSDFVRLHWVELGRLHGARSCVSPTRSDLHGLDDPSCQLHEAREILLSCRPALFGK